MKASLTLPLNTDWTECQNIHCWPDYKQTTFLA